MAESIIKKDEGVVFENMLSSPISVPPNTDVVFNLDSGKDFSNFSMITPCLYDSNYVRVSSAITRNPSNYMFNSTIAGMYGGSLVQLVIETGYTQGIVRHNANATLNFTLRGLRRKNITT